MASILFGKRNWFVSDSLFITVYNVYKNIKKLIGVENGVAAKEK